MAHTIDRPDKRTRLHPCSTGKRISPQERDLLWFSKLAEHGPLPTSFLLAFTQGMGRSEKRARERLTDLFSEDNTPDDGSYLTRPPQQFRTLDARYNQLVHDLTHAGHQALIRHGTGLGGASAPSGPWLHRFMASCVTASIELATLGRSDLIYIPQSTILARAATSLRHPVTIIDPVSGREATKVLAPDAVFGLEYKTATGSRFRFFAVEADRATEPTTSANWNRKSFERNLAQYEAYVRGGTYRAHLGLTAPLLVLTISSDAARLRRMVEFVARRNSSGISYMLFQAWECFGPAFRPPVPRHEFLTVPWIRAGLDALAIDKST